MKKSVFRVLILALLLLGTALPAAAKTPLVAVVLPGGLPRYQQAHDAFSQVLDKAGFGAGKVKLVVQKPNADLMSITNSVRRLAAARADILITYGSQATAIAKNVAPKATVLFADVYDPVALDIVKTLQAPGVTRTGASSFASMGTLVESLLAIKPAQNIGVLYNKEEQASLVQLKDMKAAAAQRGLTVFEASAGNASSAASAFDTLVSRSDCIYLSEAYPAQELANELIAAARDRGVPVISQIPGSAELGALATLEADPTEQGNLLAVHTVQVLSGKKAFILGVRTAKQIALKLNQATAARLSLSLPENLVAKADKVIR